MQSETIGLGAKRESVVYRGGVGPPLVWLHGLYGVEADAPMIDRLAERFSVVAPLAPGFADLEELEPIRDIHDLALHYDDLLEALELDRVLMAGHSFGAMIALEIAAHVPKRVSRLVVLSPIGLWNDAYPVADLFGVPPAEVPELLYADASRAPVSGQQADVERALALARGMTTVARFLWPIPDRGLARRLHRVNAPTLVVHGADDRFVPCACADDFVALLPNAARELIPGAGHMLTVEALEPTLALMTEFLGAGGQPTDRPCRAQAPRPSAAEPRHGSGAAVLRRTGDGSVPLS